MSDVIVVGAGPTGLTLACGLQAAGVDVRVLDKASGPAVTSRALGLQPRGVEVLDRLGALGDLPDGGLPIRSVTINVDGRELASFPVGQATRLGGPRGLIMSQADIEAALRDRLIALGGDVEWGRGVSGLELERDGVSVRLDDGSDADASWVVGADGAHSVVRKAMGIGFPGVPVVERLLLTDVHADIDLQRGGATSWLRGDMALTVFPLPGVDLWRVMAPTPTGFGDEPAAAAIADSYRRVRALLAGDAAHIHSPFGGQGMNTGIGDAENLAWKLALVVAGRAGERLLDTYEAERRPIAKGVLDSTSGATEVAFGQRRASQLLRDRIVVPLMNQGWLQNLITERASQLRVSYRHGPLGAGLSRFLPGIRVGDRVADRTCTRFDGASVRLYDVLGPEWALLGPETLAGVARERLGDVVALRGDRDAQLVRPDGHLAWRGADAARLRAWLDNALGEPVGVLTP
jgi:2-polyprenyl-6-methoxyphenol hydroxylase-like FAD-dependent oxidoreductase